jgi:hypothetical protein
MSSLILALMLIAGEPPAAQPPAAPLAGHARKEKVVCRMETRPGSRFAKRTCITLADFKRREEESRNGVTEMQRNLNVPLVEKRW